MKEDTEGSNCKTRKTWDVIKDSGWRVAKSIKTSEETKGQEEKYIERLSIEEQLPVCQNPSSPSASCRARSLKPPWPSACLQSPGGKRSISLLAEGPAGERKCFLIWNHYSSLPNTNWSEYLAVDLNTDEQILPAPLTNITMMYVSEHKALKRKFSAPQTDLWRSRPSRQRSFHFHSSSED